MHFSMLYNRLCILKPVNILIYISVMYSSNFQTSSCSFLQKKSSIFSSRYTSLFIIVINFVCSYSWAQLSHYLLNVQLVHIPPDDRTWLEDNPESEILILVNPSISTTRMCQIQVEDCRHLPSGYP